MVVAFLSTKDPSWIYCQLNNVDVIDSKQVQNIMPFGNLCFMRCDYIAEPFPTISKLVDAMFVLPVQTAPVERGYSMQRIVKTAWQAA